MRCGSARREDSSSDYCARGEHAWPRDRQCAQLREAAETGPAVRRNGLWLQRGQHRQLQPPSEQRRVGFKGTQFDLLQPVQSVWRLEKRQQSIAVPADGAQHGEHGEPLHSRALAREVREATAVGPAAQTQSSHARAGVQQTAESSDPAAHPPLPL